MQTLTEPLKFLQADLHLSPTQMDSRRVCHSSISIFFVIVAFFPQLSQLILLFYQQQWADVGVPVNRLFVSEKQKPLKGLDRFLPFVTGLTPSVSLCCYGDSG